MPNFKTVILDCFADLLPILANPGDELEIRDFVKGLFVSLGFHEVELPLVDTAYQVNHRIGGDGTAYRRRAPNLGLSLEGNPNQPTYVFNAHLDHYFAGNITKKLMQEGDWIVSDGNNILGADCKIGIAIIYAWVRRLIAGGADPSINLVFDTCEEAGCIGMLEFVNHNQYRRMPFYDHYKAGRSVQCFSVDGLWEEAWGKELRLFITRNNAIALSQYLMGNKTGRFCAVEGEKIRWRSLSKKDKQLIKTLGVVCADLDNLEQFRVMKYGAGFVLLSKIIPCILIPAGFIECHTRREKFWVPYLDVMDRLFDNSCF